MKTIKRPESIEELRIAMDQYVFSMFKGMDEEYKNLVMSYRNAVHTNKFSVEYLQQLRKETEENIRELMAARKILSLDKLEEIRNLYALEQTKDITEEELTTEQALLLEMKRSNALKIIDAKVKHSSSLKETYIELYDAYKDDDFYLEYMDALSQEMSKTEQMTIQQVLEKRNENPFSSELNKIMHSINGLLPGKATMFPSYLVNGIYHKNKFVLRSMDKDLDTNEGIKNGWKHAYNTDQSEGRY